MMPGRHHPTAPADPAMLTPHPREDCDRDRCGLPLWRVQNQDAYRQGYAAGYLAAIRTLQRGAEDALRIVAPLEDDPPMPL